MSLQYSNSQFKRDKRAQRSVNSIYFRDNLSDLKKWQYLNRGGVLQSSKRVAISFGRNNEPNFFGRLFPNLSASDSNWNILNSEFVFHSLGASIGPSRMCGFMPENLVFFGHLYCERINTRPSSSRRRTRKCKRRPRDAFDRTYSLRALCFRFRGGPPGKSYRLAGLFFRSRISYGH